MPRGARTSAALAALAAFVGIAFGCVLFGALASAVVGGGGVAAPSVVADIPGPYLHAYREAAARFELGAYGWSYLAAIGKIESDHGRSAAPGVSSGQNFHGCCAGPMQIHNGFGTGTATWGAYQADGDGDQRTNIYDPDDAVATAANYLRASGAPGDWRAATYAYNHAAWYVEQVRAQAARYRAASAASSSAPLPRVGTRWLAPLPGFPGERCDARIIGEVVALARAYELHVSDCYGGAPHAIAGEHPLGLAIDASPADGDWRRTERLARAAGWRPECASTGCPGRGPFRVVLYNGFPRHGDPRHSTSPHLHLSWEHGPTQPFSRAPWVRPVLDPAYGGPR